MTLSQSKPPTRRFLRPAGARLPAPVDLSGWITRAAAALQPAEG